MRQHIAAKVEAPAAAPARADVARQPHLAPPSVAATLASPGAALPDAVAAEASKLLRFDLTGVRIHHDAAAGASARELGARAYAVRPHVVFAPGAYDPASSRGRGTLLHELAHLPQQAPHDPRSPLAISTSRAHEHDADRRATGSAGPALGLPPNSIACLKDDHDDAPSLAELRATALAPKPDVTFVVEGDFVRATFAPRSVAQGGQRIIDDIDDPAKLFSIKLPTGEKATQQESKILYAYDAQVVARYKKEDIEYDKDNRPIGIKTYKPIEAKADTTHKGFLTLDDANRTALTRPKPGNPEVDDDPHVVKDYARRRVILGIFNFGKQPETLGDHTYKKLERSRTEGVVHDEAVTTVTDHTTGRTSQARQAQTTTGVTEATRGKADPRIDPATNKLQDNGDYVLSNETKGLVQQAGAKREVYKLDSGRTAVVETRDHKTSHHRSSKKALSNQGLEFQAVGQHETKTKDSDEEAGKSTTTTIYRPVERTVKLPDGTKHKVIDQVPVSRVHAYNRSFGQGKSRSEIHEGRAEQQTKHSADKHKHDAQKPAVATKDEFTKPNSAGLTANINATAEAGRGAYAAGLNTSVAWGKNPTWKKGEAPDAAPAAAKPVTGQTDLVALSDTFLGDKSKGNHLGGSLNVSDTGVTAAIDGSATLGSYKADKSPKQTGELFGLFSVDTVYSATHLAGLHLEGKLQGQAQRGDRGAVAKAAQIGASVSGSAQLGFFEERGVEVNIKPMLAKISNSTVRTIVATIDPVFNIRLKGHVFAGAEAKVDAGVTRGGDSGNPNTAGISGFVGARIGGEIEGAILIGRPLGAEADKAQGARLASIRGSIAGTVGVGGSWRSTASVVGGHVVAGGEGGLSAPLGGTGSIRMEADLWKLGTIGLSAVRQAASYAVANNATVRKADNYVNSDTAAVKLVESGAFKSLPLAARIGLVTDLLFGHTSGHEQAAVITILTDARGRGELAAIVDTIGFRRLRFALDGDNNDKFHALTGR